MFSLIVVVIIIITSIQCSHPNLIKRMIPRQHVTRQQRGGGEKEKKKNSLKKDKNRTKTGQKIKGSRTTCFSQSSFVLM